MEIVTNGLWRRDVFPPPRPVRCTLEEEIVCGRKKWTRPKIVFFNSAFFSLVQLSSALLSSRKEACNDG